ncbi:MAG: ABC transporter substrate-binding protein [Chloroflexota bacterium]|nr:ABC transporter substrate-binding protein [Chloroflexota bacterium]
MFRPATRGRGGSTFTLITASSPSDLDPHYAYNNVSSTVFLAPYEMLIQLKGSSTDEYEPMLAESWESNADGSQYTFKLAPNALFHDGSPCDAEAVKASFTRFLQQEAGPYLVIARFVDDPEQMVVVDPTTIRFDLGRPQPLFLPAMASEYGPFIVNPRAVEENKTEDDPFAHEWLRSNAAGSGPYTVEEFEVDERIVLRKFEDYHRGWEGNHFNEIVIRVVPENATRRQLIESGEADAITLNLTPDDVTALQANPDLDVQIYESTNAVWVIMNVPRLKTAEVRKRFSYAFPYDDVLSGAYKGLLERSGPLAPSTRGADPDIFLYQTDLAKAKELILSGGFKEGDTFTYQMPAEDEVERVVAQLFQANVQAMGFNLEIQEIDYAALSDLVYGDSPAEERPDFISGWGWWPDYNDPWNQLAPNFLASSFGSGGSNSGNWVNERFEAIMAEAETYTDEARLNELMREAQNILTEQDPPLHLLRNAEVVHRAAKGYPGFLQQPALPRRLPVLQDVPGRCLEA